MLGFPYCCVTQQVGMALSMPSCCSTGWHWVFCAIVSSDRGALGFLHCCIIRQGGRWCCLVDSPAVSLSMGCTCCRSALLSCHFISWVHVQSAVSSFHWLHWHLTRCVVVSSAAFVFDPLCHVCWVARQSHTLKIREGQS